MSEITKVMELSILIESPTLVSEDYAVAAIIDAVRMIDSNSTIVISPFSPLQDKGVEELQAEVARLKAIINKNLQQ